MMRKRRIYSCRKELCLICAVAISLLGATMAVAAAPRTIVFGEKEDSSSVQMFAIIGEIARPATYQVKQKEVTLKQLIDFAGGPTAAAGKKIRVLRGGKSILVLLSSGQEQFKLSDGDVVILDRAWQTAARTVSFNDLPQPSPGSGSSMMVDRANLKRSRPHLNHGQIVLLGLTSEPVVLPLWGETLTVETLLTKYMRQSQAVARKTRILVGRKNRARSDVLAAGMILGIPKALVNRDTIPRLPTPVVIGEEPPQIRPDAGNGAETSSVSPDDSVGLAKLVDRPMGHSLRSPLPLLSTTGNEKSVLKPTIIAYSEIVASGPEQSNKTEPETKSETEEQKLKQNVTLPMLPSENEAPSESEALFVPQEVVNQPPSNELISIDPEQTDREGSAVVLDDLSTDLSILADPDHSPESDKPEAESSRANLEQFESFGQYDQSQHDSESASSSSTGQDTFTALLEKKSKGAVHAAQAGEVVPNPVELKEAAGGTMIGFIAGAIVVIGVVTVIISAVRNQFPRSGYIDEQRETISERTARKSFTDQPPATQTVSPPPSSSAPVASGTRENSQPFSSDPLTRAKQEKENGLKSLLENRIPIIEERVLMPRELKFFGKPNLYYEFRLDSSHEIKKPHLASKMGQHEQKAESDSESAIEQPADGPKFSRAATRRKSAVPIFWEAETGLFVSSGDLHTKVTQTLSAEDAGNQ